MTDGSIYQVTAHENYDICDFTYSEWTEPIGKIKMPF